MNSEIRVGILFFIGLGLLLWFTVFTTQITQSKGAYVVRFPRITRLKEGDAVTYNGVRIGTVTEVAPTLENNHPAVKIAFSITSDRKKLVLVDEHTIYRIDQGLLGGSSLEIASRSGSPITPEALANAEGQEPAGVDEVLSSVKSLIDENRSGIKDAITSVKVNLDHFGKMSADIGDMVEENRKDIKSAISNISTMAGRISDLVADNRTTIKDAISNFDKMSDQIARMVEENRASLKSAIDKLPDAVGNVSSAAKSVNALVDENRPNIKSAIADIAKATPKVDQVVDNLDIITTQIASGHGTLGKLVFDDTLHDKAVQTLDDLDQRVEELKPVTRGFTELKFILGADGMDDVRSGQETYGAYLRVEPAPWKFYTGGVSYRTAPKGRTVVPDDPNNFNFDITLLIGWRWFPDNDIQAYRLSAAAGLIESEVGAVADVVLTSRLIFETEIRAKANTRPTDDRRYEQGEAMLRATLNYTFWQRFTLRLGGDDLINRPGVWVGLRAELLDNDLRNITTVSALLQ